MKNQLHLTNGDDLTESIRSLGISGEIVVWREMLCEGPTSFKLGTDEFVELRTKFLSEKYNIQASDYKKLFLEELEKITALNGCEELVLWFEFDLFSHLNMLAAISHLRENRKKVKVTLVCSKKLKGEKEQNPLSQLSLKNLQNHYDQRITLVEEDLAISNMIWQFYNSKDHQKLKGIIKKRTNFEYLSSCIRAHIERFPNINTGLNSLETNVLKLITENEINNQNQLLGYVLEYQGYYGYNAMQMERLLEKLQDFYEVGEKLVELTDKGRQALNASRNFYRELKNDECLGGVSMYDFLYDPESHKLLKL
jgi:hypothetical protein